VSINYRIEVYGIETDEGREYVAHFPALKGVAGGGISQKEAIESLLENAEYHLTFMKSKGYKIPKEDLFDEPKEYSGRFSVRTTSMVHEYLSRVSAEQGISINAYINNLFHLDMGGTLMLQKAEELKSTFLTALQKRMSSGTLVMSAPYIEGQYYYKLPENKEWEGNKYA